MPSPPPPPSPPPRRHDDDDDDNDTGLHGFGMETEDFGGGFSSPLSSIRSAELNEMEREVEGFGGGIDDDDDDDNDDEDEDEDDEDEDEDDNDNNHNVVNASGLITPHRLRDRSRLRLPAKYRN